MSWKIDILNNIITPSIVSVFLSVWIIPPAIKRYERGRKRRVIALVLGDLIKQIDICINGLSFAKVDKSRRSQIFIKSVTKPTFVHYAIAFDDELLLMSNIATYLNHYNEHKMSYREAIELNQAEFVRLNNVHNTLQNIISNYSELLDNSFVEQVVDILFLISNLNIESLSSQVSYAGIVDDGSILAKRPDCTKKLDETYKSLFRLQHRLMTNRTYFTDRVER